MKRAYVGVISSYTPVEYIESTGSQYINTNVIPNINTKWIVDYQFISGPNNNMQIGCGEGNDTKRFIISSITNFNFAIGINVDSGIASDTNRHNFILDPINKLAYIDERSISINYSSFSPQYSIMFFARYNDSGTDFIHSGRLYGSQIYQGGTLIRNFIPVIDKDNIACLYELVEGKFYYNNGTGAFNAGNTTGSQVILGSKARKITKAYVGVTSSYTPVEYIESSGTQFIDSCLKPYHTKAEIKFKLTQTPSNYGHIASCFNENNNRYYVLTYRGDSNPKYFYTTSRDNNATTLQTPVDTNDHIVIYNNENNKVLFDGVEKATISDLTTQAVRNMYLFAMHGGSNLPQDFFVGRIYYAKFWDKDTNTLVRDFIPVVDEENIPCMWDKVEEKLYPNKGAGFFTAGATTGEPAVYSTTATRLSRRAYIGEHTYLKKLDYIESSGTQYINTMYKANEKTKLVVEGCILENVGSLFGCGVSNSYSQISLSGTSGNYVSYFRKAASADVGVTSTIPVGTTKHIFELDKTGFIIDGATIGTTSISYSDTYKYDLVIFGFRNAVIDVEKFSSSRIYSFKIYENNTLIKEFIPVKDKNNVVCLFETVESRYYYNQGSGNFIAGSSVQTNDLGDKAQLLWGYNYNRYTEHWKNTTDYNYGTFSITHTNDYIISSGGGTYSDPGGTPGKKVNAFDINMVKYSCPDLTTQAQFQGTGCINNYGIVCGGKSASSGSSRTNECTAYSNNLTKVTMSPLTTSIYDIPTAYNSVHFIVSAGCGYNSDSVYTDSYDTNLVKTRLTSASCKRQSKGGAAVGDYLVFCGGKASPYTTDFYDNNNVKTTGANPYPSHICFNAGISIDNYALFFGGSQTESGPTYNYARAYDKNLVLFSFTMPDARMKVQGFSVSSDYVLVGQGNNVSPAINQCYFYVYDNNLIVKERISTPCYCSEAGQLCDANGKFALAMNNWTGLMMLQFIF